MVNCDTEHKIVKRLESTIKWVDSKLSYLAFNDKESYVDFEWLKSHLTSIRDHENRREVI